MKGNIARLTSLLEQALRSSSKEEHSTQPIVAAQSTAPQNISAPGSQFTTYFLVPPIKSATSCRSAALW
jgi:hypothetical protein